MTFVTNTANTTSVAKNNTNAESNENSSGQLGACRCSNLCYRDKTHAGCTSYTHSSNVGDVNDRNSARRSNDVSTGAKNETNAETNETSSGQLGACRCSNLCYRDKTHAGCTSHSRSSSVSDVNDRNARRPNDLSSDSLVAPCRCSRLCYRTSSRHGCTSEKPEISNRRRSSGDLKETGCKHTSDVKDNTSSQLIIPCRHSRLCYRTNSHQRCMNQAPNDNRPYHYDLNRNESDSVGSCVCARISRRTPSYGACYDNHSDGSSQSSNIGDMRRSRSASLDSCHCYDRYQNYAPEVNIPYNNRARNRPNLNRPGVPGCMCGVLTNEIPVKEPRTIDECLCQMNSFPNNQMSGFSLDSMDLRYLEQVRLLTQHDCKLTQELDDLAAQEAAIRCTIKQYDQPPSLPVLNEKVENSIKSNKSNNVRMLRALNKELSILNETLSDRIQDLRLERDQLSQKIDGPLTRELERLRKKYIQLQSEVNVKSHPDYVETTSEELELLKAQLLRTQENIGDIALVNDGIKQEVLVLEYKCDQMEKVLIKQKVNEIDAINQLQGADICRSASQEDERPSSVDTSPSCSCTQV